MVQLGLRAETHLEEKSRRAVTAHADYLENIFPDEGYSFHEGIVLVSRDSCLEVQCAQVHCWLLDGDAVPKVTSAKTMSAFKPCCKCQNTIARRKPEDIHAGPEPSTAVPQPPGPKVVAIWF